MAKQLQISRTPVREALRRLSTDGLIEFASGRGMMITQLNKQQVRELYFLRKVLEGAAAGLAAHHAVQDDIALMRALLQKSQADDITAAEMANVNRRLHRAIYEAAHNLYLAKALDQLADSLALLPGTTFEEPGRARQAVLEHKAVVDAIEARDPAQAETLARKHIEMAAAVRINMMFDGT